MGRAAQLEGYSPKRISVFEEVVHKSKRSARHHTASCGPWPCAAPPNYCPPGPQGPPGDPGYPGGE
uniref:Uncharacterized protein n=1 Tax=Parascaris equorum TaxID=6256 RepID=A0A914RML6_PAREQ